MRKSWGSAGGKECSGEQGLRVAQRMSKGSAGCGCCWGIRVSRVVGSVVKELELVFLPFVCVRERQRKRETLVILRWKS